MARFGQGLIQALTNPSYQQGMFNLGSAIGSAPAQRRDQQAKSTAMTLVNEALASQDPKQIQSAAVALQKAGMNAEAMELSKAAGQLRVKSQETGIGRQLQSGLNAITSAARRGVPFEELTKLQDSVVKFGGTNEQIINAYNAGLKDETSKPVSISPGGALVSSTGEVLYERGFKPEAAKEPKVSFQKRDDGSLLVFEGSKLVQTIEAPEKGTNQDAAMDLITKTVFFQGEVDKLMTDIPLTGSGFLGGTAGKVAGIGGGYDRSRDIINLKSYLGFEQIDEMKRQAQEAGASGTGLGQVSNIELLSLQSTVDALDIGMSAEAQKEALGNIKRHLRTVQLLASGVAPKDAIEWDTPTYKVAGYHQDPETGDVFFAPDGPSGTVYILRDGKFVNAGL